MKKILIIGGCGFVGGNIATSFAQKGHEIVVMDNLVRRGGEFNLERFKQYKNIRFVHGDSRCREDLDNIKFYPDVVLDCSSQPTATDGYKNFYFDVSNNTLSVVNIIEYCRKYESDLIYWSTNKVYSGNQCNSVPYKELETKFSWVDSPNFHHEGWSTKGFSETFSIDGNSHTIYGASKLCGDLLVQETSIPFGIRSVVNRFSCLYGDWQWGKVEQGWVMSFIIHKLLGKPITIFGFEGKQVRDVLFVDDMINLIERQIDKFDSHLEYHDVYNIGGGVSNSISVLEMNNKLDEMMGVKSKLIFDSPRREDQKIFICNTEKAQKHFSWSPMNSIEKGLEKSIKWASDNMIKLRKIL